ncbi:MAG: hypothetical protein ABJM06_07825 [Gilvibacter sp.]
MNSYNDNLRSTVLASLNEQDLATKSSGATMDAASLTMFYAEGAKITATTRLVAADKTYKEKKEVNIEAVAVSNLSTNVMSTATQENALTAQSVTNAAVSAGNVQIAATAIVKLASDVGSIFNIVEAANKNTEIYRQAQKANERISATAYRAETLSKRAMDASANTAKISASTVENLATVADASIKELETIAAGELVEIAGVVEADNEALAEASIAEKAAEGDLEEAVESYNAIYQAFDFTNDTLNHELTATAASATEYAVSFKVIEAAFGPKGSASESGMPYPVKDYYIMVAKNDAKSTFSLDIADGIYTTEDLSRKVKKEEYDSNTGVITVDLKLHDISDVEGNDIELGEDYVAFVFAVYDDKYKTILNDFSNYLSAPSQPFTLQKELRLPRDFSTKESGKETHTTDFIFKVTKNGYDLADYHCMFLPQDNSLADGVLTTEDLDVLAAQIAAITSGPAIFEDEILDLMAQLVTKEVELEVIEEKRVAAKATLTKAAGKGPLLSPEDRKRKKYLEECIDTLKAAIKKLEDTKTRDRKKKGSGKNGDKAHAPSILFDQKIAENIPPANYISVSGSTGISDTEEEKPGSSGKGKKPPKEPVLVTFTVPLKAETTDCYGNRLSAAQKYFPVVLSVSNKPAEIAIQFKNRISRLTNQDLISVA